MSPSGAPAMDPVVPAGELRELLASQDDLVLLDARGKNAAAWWRDTSPEP